MTEYTLVVRVACPPHIDDLIDDLMDAVEPYHAAVTVSPGSVRVRATVEANSPHSARKLVEAAVRTVLQEARHE